MFVDLVLPSSVPIISRFEFSDIYIVFPMYLDIIYMYIYIYLEKSK